MAKSPDLSSLSVAELKDLIESANTQMRDLREQELEVAREKCRDAAEAVGETVESLFRLRRPRVASTGTGSGRRTSKAEPKYRDPSTGATWTGRGRKPKWFEHAIKVEGKSPDDFLI